MHIVATCAFHFAVFQKILSDRSPQPRRCGSGEQFGVWRIDDGHWVVGAQIRANTGSSIDIGVANAVLFQRLYAIVAAQAKARDSGWLHINGAGEKFLRVHGVEGR